MLVWVSGWKNEKKSYKNLLRIKPNLTETAHLEVKNKLGGRVENF